MYLYTAELQYSNRLDDCLREMLKLWLSSTPRKEDLIEALKTLPVGFGSLADELIGWIPPSPALHCQDNTSSVHPTLESAAVELTKQPETPATQVGGYVYSSYGYYGSCMYILVTPYPCIQGVKWYVIQLSPDSPRLKCLLYGCYRVVCRLIMR